MPQMELLTVNISGTARHATMMGRDYLVVPMVMITEGVHTGSGGPLYYPSDELSRNTSSWDHKPIVVYHPERNGAGVSACDPDVLTNRCVGVILNTKYIIGNSNNPGRLKAEAWLEKDRLGAVDERVLNSIESNSISEVSTGLFTDKELTPGDWKSKPYDAIARNYRPDHLAILPDKIGACSVKDGAGLLRNQATDHRPTNNEMSFDDIRYGLASLLPNKSWICDIFGKYIIYSDDDGKLYQIGYIVDQNDDISLVGDSVQVVRYSEYRTVDGKPIRNEDSNTMDRKTAVTNLLALNAGWTEDDLIALESMPEGSFAKIAAQAATKPPTTPVGNQGAAGVGQPIAPVVSSAPMIQNNAPVIDAAKPATAPTLAEYIHNAPPELRDVLMDGVVTLNAKKSALVAEIVANKANTFAAEYLAGQPAAMLEAIAKLGRSATPVMNYSGNVGSMFIPPNNPTTNAALAGLPLLPLPSTDPTNIAVI